MSIGRKFQAETKHNRHNLSGGLDWNSQPEPYKTYPGAERVNLPKAKPMETDTIDKVLRNRRSVRNYTPESISLQELSYLLWASTGISKVQGGHGYRTAPSAGALYPIETYIMVNNVKGVNRGIYHYNIQDHDLELVNAGDHRRAMSEAGLGQNMIGKCQVTFIWSAIFQRSIWKYRQRAYRYVYLDAGHIAGNLCLAAVGIGLDSCQIAAIFDDEANALLGLDGEEESVIYMSVVGH